MTIKLLETNTRVPIKLWTADVEQEALQQLRNTANLPFIHNHVAAMPDVHFGKGATIGSVIATKGAIIPAAVGVDIGCGMTALMLPFSIDRLGGDAKLSELRHSIERSIPTGRYKYNEMDDRRAAAFTSLGEINLPIAKPGENSRIISNAGLQLGTLGGGNHFIEICRDTQNRAWIMLHSGSRNIGKHLADRHIDKAKDLMKKYFIDLPDPDLAYLVQGSEEFKAYLKDLMWAQAYAKANRHEMLLRVLREVWRVVYGPDSVENPESILNILFKIDCHHNYTKQENHFGHNVWVTRKGAVSARDGEFGIIPGSMGVKSFIVKGKGNLESFCSCSHGAGRKMSRKKARASFTVEDLITQTSGVECRKDDAVIDEIPSAYKNIDEVMENQSDLVEVFTELKQVICIKGA